MTPEEENADLISALFESLGIEPTDEQTETMTEWAESIARGGMQQGMQRAAGIASYMMEEEELEQFIHSLNNAVFINGGMIS